MGHRDLLDRWRRDLEVLRRNGAVEAATATEAHIADLEEFERQYADELLDLTRAALERGVHPDTISRHLKAGRLVNRGRDGAPLIRRGDLMTLAPTKKKRSGLPDLAAAIAASST